jgi:DNA-binding response OmpR family regulator
MFSEGSMSAPRPILIVEDDDALRATLAELIGKEGEFSAVEVGSATAAEEILTRAGAHSDAILLDVGLPDADGRDFCAKLRRNGQRMPVIMLTGADGEADVVRGLEAGANDYIAKPFRVNEVLARVRAQLRSFDNSEHAVLKFGSFKFRPSAKLLEGPGGKHRIRLTSKECMILKFLHRLDGQPAPRTQLLHEVWGYSSAVSTHTLETHIYRLRQKIEADPSQPRLLLSVTGGYRLSLGAVTQGTGFETH